MAIFSYIQGHNYEIETHFELKLIVNQNMSSLYKLTVRTTK